MNYSHTLDNNEIKLYREIYSFTKNGNLKLVLKYQPYFSEQVVVNLA